MPSATLLPRPTNLICTYKLVKTTAAALREKEDGSTSAQEMGERRD